MGRAKRSARLTLQEAVCLACLIVVFVVAMLIIQHYTAATILELTVISDTDGIFQIYYRGKKEDYHEDNSKNQKLKKNVKQHIQVPFRYVDKIATLRIDPLQSNGYVTITQAEARSNKNRPVDLLPMLAGDGTIRLKDISVIKGKDITLQTTGNDPHLEITLPQLPYCTFIRELIASGCILYLILLLLLNQRLIRGDKNRAEMIIELPEPTTGLVGEAETFAAIIRHIPHCRVQQTRKGVVQWRIIVVDFIAISGAETARMIKRLQAEIPHASFRIQYFRPADT